MSPVLASAGYIVLVLKLAKHEMNYGLHLRIRHFNRLRLVVRFTRLGKLGNTADPVLLKQTVGITFGFLRRLYVRLVVTKQAYLYPGVRSGIDENVATEKGVGADSEAVRVTADNARNGNANFPVAGI